ncbi:Nitroreductase-like protein [Xylariaceae sp. FL0804]|nr:Nitroreductase-like protein [Xylariaceae sp. FL0804]
MRPQVLASALVSAARLPTTTATISAPTCAALRTPSTSSLLRITTTCAAATTTTTTTRHFSTSGPPLSRLVRPNSETATSKQEIPLSAPKQPISTTMSDGAESVLSLLKQRRTYYALKKELPVPTARIQEIVSSALQDVPSSFNSQSNRVLLLLGAEHDRYWDVVEEVLRPFVPDEKAWEGTQKRVAGFRAGAGTVLCFSDDKAVQAIQDRVPLYRDKFPGWAQESCAMLQYALWVALEAAGCGASIQHYNPLVDARVQAQWGVPQTWRLQAQLVFGGQAGQPGDKKFDPVEEKLMVAGA